ncbi:MAG TPA: dipeptide/oligopeptide/nickel ABC transporter ATP-binding protein, partial [Mesotoga sp.]|nr:dipeptide/oligopeptide/nickel ABC transporter ATP-binding protein [Mesotoga sp.]
MLELINLTKVFKTGTFSSGRLKAVNNVSFEIERGEVTSLIGESGSGKSTIGKMILRLLTITAGEIKLDERSISTIKGAELRQYYRKVQGVFQDPFSSYNPIFKVDRVFENLRDVFFRELRHSEWKDKVNSALKLVGLDSEQVLGKYPHQLSGGQLQRILISRALLLDVSFLVADELISMLDASTRIDVLNLLADLKKGGLSILFITHDLSLGYYLSEKAVILYRGHVVEMGST